MDDELREWADKLLQKKRELFEGKSSLPYAVVLPPDDYDKFVMGTEPEWRFCLGTEPRENIMFYGGKVFAIRGSDGQTDWIVEMNAPGADGDRPN